MCDVSVVRCESYDLEAVSAALEEVLEPLGGLAWVKEGMKVLIKPNLVSARRPETAVATHPALVCALTRKLTARGAEVYIADSPGGPFTAALMDRVYRVTGMKEAEKYGAKLNAVVTASQRRAPQAAVAREMTICDYLNGMDAVINVCKLKTHGMMGMSAAAKNLFGIVPGTVKPEYHFRFPDPMDFARMIVDLGEYVRPALHICDAVVAMEGNGPTAGKPRPLGMILAAKNPHMLDLACARVIGCGDVPTLQAARERGLVPASAEDLDIRGELTAVDDWDIVRQYAGTRFQSAGRGPVAWARNKVLPLLLTARPQVKARECVGCARCAEVWPARAITMRPARGKVPGESSPRRLPEIDRDKCIRCFCCQEFCPKGAMKVKRPLVARAAQRIR